jgi:hypothetical protein
LPQGEAPLVTALTTPREQLGTAFGVHRALATTVAMLGPLLALGMLALAPGRFDAIFVVRFCIALVGLGILVLFVQNQRDDRPADEAPAVSLRSAARLLESRKFAVPVGKLADRFGRLKIFVAGYVVLLALYATIRRTSSSPTSAPAPAASSTRTSSARRCHPTARASRTRSSLSSRPARRGSGTSTRSTCGR